MYEHLARYNVKRGQRSFGRSPHGNPYAHLLPADDALRNFLEDEHILAAVKRRFASHKAGAEERALTNTAASQAFCFNLFVPLAEDLALASRLFSELFGRAVRVEHIEIEFTPNALSGPSGFERGDRDESLGDQSGTAGTDADVAVFFSEPGRRQELLIETKLIEAGFSTCKSFAHKQACKTACVRPDFCERLVEGRALDVKRRALCGYNAYENWTLTIASRALGVKAIRSSPACPFRFSGQQLWRNMLLAEKVCEARKLHDFAFWVLSPRDNVVLWQETTTDVEAGFRRVLTPFGNERFRRVTMEDVFALLQRLTLGTSLERWMAALTEKYVVP